MREQPTCDVPHFPQVATLSDWKLDLYDKVSVCAQDKDPSDVFRWLKAVEGTKVHRRDITDPGPGFVMLDRKLACALIATLSGELKRHTASLRAKKAAKDELLGGREVLLEIYRHFATSRYTTKLYGLSDIVSITWLGDNQKTAFKNLWESRVSRVKNDVPEYGKAEVFFEALSKSKDLEVEMMFYNQRHPGHIKPKNAKRRYNSLMRILDNAIITERERSNQEKQQKADKKVLDQYRAPSAKPAAPAPAPQAKNSSQPNGKGKGGGGKDGKNKEKSQKGKGDKKGGKDGKDSKPKSDKGSGKGPGHRQLCVNFIYAKCTAKECIYNHAHPETPEEKEHYKALYKTVSARSRSQSPASAKNIVCRYWKAGNCTYGKECRFSHSHPAAPSTEATKEAGQSAGAKRRARRKRSQSRVSDSSSASSTKGKSS